MIARFLLMQLKTIKTVTGSALGAERPNAHPPGSADKIVNNRRSPTGAMGGPQKGQQMTQDTIRRIIKAEKKRQRRTWPSIAKESGLSRATIENYCCGCRNTSMNVIEALLDTLNLELFVRRKRDTS